jgi:hypothetical protein
MSQFDEQTAFASIKENQEAINVMLEELPKLDAVVESSKWVEIEGVLEQLRELYFEGTLILAADALASEAEKEDTLDAVLDSIVESIRPQVSTALLDDRHVTIRVDVNPTIH